ASVVGHDLGERLDHAEGFLGLNFDIRNRSAESAGTLVDHDAAVRQGESLARCAGCQQNGRHGGSHTHTVGLDIGADHAHGVVNSETTVNLAAGRVDVQVNVSFRIVVLEEEQLGDHQVCHLAFNLGAEEDD